MVLGRPIGGCILAFGCIKIAQSIEQFPGPPVLMMWLVNEIQEMRQNGHAVLENGRHFTVVAKSAS